MSSIDKSIKLKLPYPLLPLFPFYTGQWSKSSQFLAQNRNCSSRATITGKRTCIESCYVYEKLTEIIHILLFLKSWLLATCIPLCGSFLVIIFTNANAAGFVKVDKKLLNTEELVIGNVIQKISLNIQDFTSAQLPKWSMTNEQPLSNRLLCELYSLPRIMGTFCVLVIWTVILPCAKETCYKGM